MYKIDWKQYLSSERFRSSSFNQKIAENKVNRYSEYRTPFESDFGRVAFSSAVRRMHDKTQVMPLTSGDSVHTRLTHCVEVMSIAYSLGIDLCRDPEFRQLYTDKDEIIELERNIPVILKTAAFVHDIGNPPFGHFGETVIQDYFKKYLSKRQITDAQALDFTHFDGNAEGFRILTRLQYIGDLSGLNLTYATLATYTKYPNMSNIDKSYIGNKKHGIFTSEKEVFEQMIDKCHLKIASGGIKRHPLSFLLEAADSISYCIMDIEDGFTMGWYTFDEIIKFLNSQCDEDILVKLKLSDKFGEYREDDRRKMTDFRVAIVSHLVHMAIINFKQHLEEIDKGTYSKELIEDGDSLSKHLGAFAKANIYPNPQIEQIELTGHSVLTGLLDKLLYYATSGHFKLNIVL